MSTETEEDFDRFRKEDVNMTSKTHRFTRNAIIIHTIFCLLVVGAAPSALGAKPSIPRPEHPKPQFKREAWINLNGQWDFVTDHEVVGIKENWQNNQSKFDKKITVPFCVESKLSGIGHTDFIKAVWYHRTFDLPKNWKDKRVFLHFGGVDYECLAWVNGKAVGRHYGGSVSFALEITDAVKKGENDLVVYAYDDVQSEVQPSGKQSTRRESYGVHYTRVTGIWQTVWLEARPKSFLESVRIVPDLDNNRFILTPTVNNYQRGLEFRATLLTPKGKKVASSRSSAESGSSVVLNVRKPRPWGLDDPYLYDLRLELMDKGKVIDSVKSYAGLRKFHIEGNLCYLNNKPIFQRLVLDQGFYPDGIWTARSDAALKADIEMSMAVGFNGARLHQKVFEERFHYWADKLGYLTWGEFADWGRVHSFGNPQGVLNLEREWRDVVLRDRNHPSIVAWTPLNETSGAARNNYEAYSRSVKSIVALTRAIDPTRPINDASGYVHVETDIFTVHDYDQNPETFRERYAAVSPDSPEDAFVCVRERSVLYEGQPYIVDEYGGTFWTKDHVNHPKKAGKRRNSWGYGKTREQVEDRIKALTDILLNHPNIVGFTYTQLTDVEQEVNGVYTYDRKPKFDIKRLKSIFGAPAAVEK
jgi:beta-galactosidase/beta-glucuronidase